MAGPVLASFTANDGSGLWEVTPEGVRVGGTFYRFTDTAHIVQCGTQGRTERHTREVEDDDDLALWQALAVYWETGSLRDAGLAAWALGIVGTTTTEVEHRLIPGTVQLSIGGLALGAESDVSLRYREDGLHVQVDAIQHFADVALAAIKAYRVGPQVRGEQSEKLGGSERSQAQGEQPARPVRRARRR